MVLSSSCVHRFRKVHKNGMCRECYFKFLLKKHYGK